MESLLGFLELQRRLHRDILTALHDKEERDQGAAGTSTGQKKKPARYPCGAKRKKALKCPLVHSGGG